MADHYYAVVAPEQALRRQRSDIIVGTASTGTLSTPSGVSLNGSAAGGSLAAVTVFVKITLVNAAGETLPSPEGSFTFAAGTTNEVIVTSPPATGNATGYKVYAATSTGGEQVQNAGAAIAIGTNYTITAVATGGASPPGANTATGNPLELRVQDGAVVTAREVYAFNEYLADLFARRDFQVVVPGTVG